MIDGLPVGVLTPSALLAIGVLLLFTGRLVPRATVDRMVSDHVREIDRLIAEHVREMEDISHDRDEWRAESRLKDAQIAERDEQLRVVKVIGETTRATLDALNASLPGGRRQESP